MSGATARFGEVVDEYYRAWFRYQPEAAVEVGVYAHADRLTPEDETAHAAIVSLNNALIAALGALDREGLSDDARLDHDLLLGGARLQNAFYLEQHPQRPDPQRYLPLDALHQLTLRPVPDFAAAMRGRLAAVPAHLHAAETALRPQAARVPRLWCESALASARAGDAFLASIPAHPALTARQGEFADLTRDATTALTRFADFLAREVAPQARGDFACGADHFNDLLRLRHFLDIDADTLHDFGTRLMQETERDLKDAARALGASDVAAATAALHAQHPAAAELLPVYRAQMQAARDFVAAGGMVDLPAPERLDVVETPAFLRQQIPFAAYVAPAPNDARQQGYYYVTPPTDAAQLAVHDRAGIMLTCVHEAYPGHHLQFVTANAHACARTVPRLLNTSATLYEGWALYCEQLMHEQGFLALPMHRFVLLKDRLWRALRVVLDVELHTRGLTLDAAATRMQAALGFTREQALADLTWYSRAPTVPMGYATGWALINAARDRAELAPGFTPRGFHADLLRVGSIALPLVLKRAFGDGLWRAARQMVFPA